MPADVVTDSAPRRKMTYVKHKWIEVGEYQSQKEIEDIILPNYVKCDVKKTNEGTIIFYRCVKSKKKDKQCKSRRKILVCATSVLFVLYSTGDEHDHLEGPTRGLSDEAYEILGNVLKTNHRLTAKPGKRELTRQNILSPSIPQVRYAINKIKNKDFKGPENSITGLQDWCKSLSVFPEDLDEVFVLKHECNSLDDFIFILSTPRLLQNALANGEFLQADGTYQISWEGHPFITIGTSDRQRQFHIIALALTTNERACDYEFCFRALQETLINEKSFQPKILMADGAHAIGNGFRKVFGTDTIVKMCWAHASKKMFEKSSIQELSNDISILQLASSESIFKTALKLFLEEWENEKEFISYFKKEWTHKNRNWYEGICPRVGSTNNSQEGFHKTVKDQHTVRERVKTDKLCESMIKMVNDWSLDYKGGTKVYQNKPTITSDLWRMAYAISENPNGQIRRKGRVFFINKGGAEGVKTQEEWTSFEDYKRFTNYFFTVNMPDNDLYKGSCTCMTFLKKYMCEHVLGIAIHQDLIKPPDFAKIPVSEKKRGVGRPKKAQKALVRSN